VETHISLLFFVGDRVYKLRKQVQFGFLDFRTREARLLDCRREVELNGRLAPDVYLGVADIQLNSEPVDHMVVMRHLPEGRKLAAQARRGDDLDEQLRQVAGVLARFHARALRSPVISAEASPEALVDGWEANFDETRRFVGTLLDRAVESEIRSLSHRWIEGHGTLLSERAATGRVCDGHGDLQAEDIFCLDDGVRILDCVEFDDRLRYDDVIADVAFLAMDLERLGRGDAARFFLSRYREASGDPMPESLVHYYCASRAYVRAKVCCLRTSQGVEGVRAEAAAFHALALGHLRRARERLVLVGGLPGSGKSTLAAGLGAARGWTVLRSDEIRREPGVATEQWTEQAADRYRPRATEVVYHELLRQAEECLGAGGSVVLDASWVDAAWRHRARTVAERAACQLVELCCETTPEEADRRINRRLAEDVDISEATPAVRAAMGARMDPWVTAVVIDTTGASPQAALDAAVRECPEWLEPTSGVG
jgi:aminoglycoside phosphotransferase family enzyme